MTLILNTGDRPMMKRHIIMASLAVALLATTASAEITGAWVTTDRTVDCSSMESIIAGVIKPGMTDEQKAIAMYDFYRQMVYHYRNMPESRNVLKCVNVLGNTLCGSQATCMKGLLEAAGIKVRVVSHPGHTFYEAFYDGKWHGYDTMTNFYVFTRGEKRNVASFEELNKDPSLIKDAVKEGRACEGICGCGDKPMSFAAKIRVLNYQPQKNTWSPKDYSLRPGEEIVRSWWPHDRPLPGTYRTGNDPGPMHGCSWRDERNPRRLFQHWEPYGIRGMGKKRISYRHYCNGWMTYSPDLAAGETAKALATGELVVPVKCPYYISGTALAFEAAIPEGGAVEVSVSINKGKAWRKVFTARDAGSKEYRTSLGSSVIRKSRGLHEYQMKFAVKGGAELKRFNLKTIFTHNAMASPALLPGANKVTVAAANGDALKATPLTLVYRYKDAPAWSGPVKTVEKTISASPTTFDIDLAKTEKFAQMQDLTLRCGKINWTPKKRTTPNKIVFDFAKPASVTPWTLKSGPPIKLSHNGEGMLMEVTEKSTFPQVRTAPKLTDWSEYANVVVELENLGAKAQEIVLRVRSGEDNVQRSDVQFTAAKGGNVLRAAVTALKKTKLNNVQQVYIMTLNVPAEGCKVVVKRIYLEPKKDL